MWVVNATPRPLYPQERPDTHRMGGWVGLRAGLEECGKSRPQRYSIPGPCSSLYRLSYPGPINLNSILPKRISDYNERMWASLESCLSQSQSERNERHT